MYQLKTRAKLDRMLASNPFSFVNVRHPFERLVSAYTHLRHSEWFTHLANKTCAEFLTEVVLKEASISTNKKKMEKMNQNWRPYNALCAFCSYNYSLISKTETFAEDEFHVRTVLGLQDRKQKKLGVTAGDKINNLTKQCFQEITDEERRTLLDLYKYDFEMFGYNPDIYLG